MRGLATPADLEAGWYRFAAVGAGPFVVHVGRRRRIRLCKGDQGVEEKLPQHEEAHAGEHVMERESFEDDGIAALMNDAFVNVKVDREERPDVDGIYMTACQMVTGHGGWPLTVVMTPAMVGCG